MTSRTRWMALALTALFGLSACSGDAEQDAFPDAPGQEQMTPGQEQAAPGQTMDPEAMALMMEAQQIQQELAPVREEAMQDEALAIRMSEIQESIETAMRTENPQAFERMEAFEADFVAAQEAGDQERVQEIGTEAQEVQMELQALQQSVLERPEIRDSIEEFEAAQRERMIEIDPEAGERMDRIDEILAEIGTP